MGMLNFITDEQTNNMHLVFRKLCLQFLMAVAENALLPGDKHNTCFE